MNFHMKPFKAVNKWRIATKYALKLFSYPSGILLWISEYSTLTVNRINKKT